MPRIRVSRLFPWEEIHESMLCKSGNFFARGFSGTATRYPQLDVSIMRSSFISFSNWATAPICWLYGAHVFVRCCMQLFESLLDSTKDVRDRTSHSCHARPVWGTILGMAVASSPEDLFSQPATLVVQPSVRVQISCLRCVLKKKCSGEDPGTFFFFKILHR